MTSPNTTMVSWVGKNALRILFPFTLPWIPLFFSAEYFYNVIPEGKWFHDLIEILLIPAALVVSMLFSVMLYRFWPTFLRVEGKVTLWFIVKKLLVNTLLVFVVLTVVTVLVSLFADPPPWKSDNPQYIPIVFFTIVFYPPLLTPTFVLIAMWRSILLKDRESP
jgi:NADH:ubiquinone oxidoreductase subunit 6 (subunit J)